MKIVSGLCGGVLGLIIFGFVMLAGTTLGLPEGVGWWALGMPSVAAMATLAAIQK